MEMNTQAGADTEANYEELSLLRDHLKNLKKERADFRAAAEEQVKEWTKEAAADKALDEEIAKEKKIREE